LGGKIKSARNSLPSHCFYAIGFPKSSAMTKTSKPGIKLSIALGAGLIVYGGLAYGIAPNYWRHFENQVGLAQKSMLTTTALGIPGDALNVGLEGERDDVLCGMRAAGWKSADPVTLKSSVKIVGSVLARRAYATAPVSDLFWEGRREDLAFEKPSGVSASHRDHVRFWRALDVGQNGAPVWLGGATYDRSVGLSHYTGQVTHHIAADIDSERDLLIADLISSGHVLEIYQVTGVGPTLRSYNGGGDIYFTDGEIRLARLKAGCESAATVPEVLPVDMMTQAKTMVFAGLGWIWRKPR
jgi:hypothetical protein